MTGDCRLPLEQAENQLLEVLLTEFDLAKEGEGCRLEVRFGPRTPAIRHRSAKQVVEDAVPGFKERAERLQAKLDRLLLAPGAEKPAKAPRFKHRAADFPFRYASGGALPVVSMGEQLFYYFRWRDTRPVGWNIANGGSDNRQELIDPELIIERELLEELIIIDPTPDRACRYVFGGDEAGSAVDRDAEAAWREWRKEFIRHKYPDRLQHQTERIPLQWLRGPDSVEVEFNGETQSLVEGVFLNINAHDLGIEIDRIVRMRLPKTAILCDGELLNGRLLDSPVGLFEVGEVQRLLDEGRSEFRPDLLYYHGRKWPKGALDTVVGRFLRSKTRKKQRTSKDRADYEAAKKERRCFDLCPVTRSIVRRHMQQAGQASGDQRNAGEPKVFISFGSEDLEFARRLHDVLTNLGISVFLSDRSLRDADFGRGIDRALGTAQCLIAVGTKVEHLLKDWPQYEWRSFSQDIFNGLKRDAQLLSLVCGIDPRQLPGQLRFRHAVVCHDPDAVETVLPELMRYLPGVGR